MITLTSFLNPHAVIYAYRLGYGRVPTYTYTYWVTYGYGGGYNEAPQETTPQHYT